MEIVLNVLIIAVVGLIAYWWGNQGLFSAILHLLCVIVAGAIAFSLWETVVHGLLLKGGKFDPYAWGVGLIGLFAVSLLILRIAMDKLAPNNVVIPHWANLVFGIPVGAVAGIITMGIVVIGCGMVQSTRDIMGFSGIARNQQSGTVEQLDTLWVPVHDLTGDFYSMLSVGSLRSGTPLRQYQPDIAGVAVSLHRDTMRNGRGEVAMPHDAAKVSSWMLDQDARLAGVTMLFENTSRDFGEFLALSSAQIRLVEAMSGAAEPAVVHPELYVADGGEPGFFDGITQYYRGTPAQQTGSGLFIFRLPADFGAPKFIFVKGNRYELTQDDYDDTFDLNRIIDRARNIAEAMNVEARGGDITSAINVTEQLRRLRADKNTMPGGIDEIDGYLTEGDAVFPPSGGRVDRTLQIRGIYEPDGTRIVQVDVSRNSRANIFGSVLPEAERDAELILVDSFGREYHCIGYAHFSTRGIRIKLDRDDYVDQMSDGIPQPARGADEQLLLIFNVTEGSTITEFKFGSVVVGTCNVPIQPR